MEHPHQMPDDLHHKGNEKESHIIPKKGMKDALKKPDLMKNRQFDRHSGTGRGKEISKNGLGGKFTWDGKGNDLQREAYENEEEDFERQDPGNIKKDFNK